MTIETFMDTQVDAFGTPLEVGDKVLHVFNHDSSTLTISKAVVVGRTLKRIKITISETRHNGELINSPFGPKLTTPHSLIKVD